MSTHHGDRAGGDMSSDERAYWQHAVRTGQPNMILPFLYPRLFALHDVHPQSQGLPGTAGVVDCEQQLATMAGTFDSSNSC